MAENRALFAVIARRVPAIWDTIDEFEIGSSRFSESKHAALNPQPLPPEAFGVRSALELVRLAWGYRTIQGEWPDPLQEAGVPLGPYRWPRHPRPPRPQDDSDSGDEPDSETLAGYYLGFACALADASIGLNEWPPFLQEPFDNAVDALGLLL